VAAVETTPAIDPATKLRLGCALLAETNERFKLVQQILKERAKEIEVKHEEMETDFPALVCT
jgi:hypothetical protein